MVYVKLKIQQTLKSASDFLS